MRSASPTRVLSDGEAAPRLSFEDVYREHFDFVFRQAARLGGSDIDAEDAVQDVFMIVMRKLERFDCRALITTWRYAITLNVVRTLRRRARKICDAKEAFEYNEENGEPSACSIDRVEVRDAHRIAYEILDKLAAKKREVFILAELEGLTCDEIAVVVGTKTATVWSRLHYARKEFAEHLEARAPTDQT
jgi:RNA polymerase sigma-70 factor (ECF subfamily)